MSRCVARAAGGGDPTTRPVTALLYRPLPARLSPHNTPAECCRADAHFNNSSNGLNFKPDFQFFNYTILSLATLFLSFISIFIYTNYLHFKIWHEIVNSTTYLNNFCSSCKSEETKYNFDIGTAAYRRVSSWSALRPHSGLHIHFCSFDSLTFHYSNHTFCME